MNTRHWVGFDKQMSQHKTELSILLNINIDRLDNFATQISTEIKLNAQVITDSLRSVGIPDIKDIFSEILSFQKATDRVLELNNNFANQMQLIAQNYICFVYLKDRIIKILIPILSVDSIALKTASYLVGPEIRGLRNAISHGEWRYIFSDTFNGIEYGTPSGLVHIQEQDYQIRTRLSLCFIYILAQEIWDYSGFEIN